MKHGVVIAVIGVLIFIGAGAFMVSGSHCGLGPKNDDPTLNDTPQRNDDKSFFAHMVCIAQKGNPR
jgi:hypothetical protein